MFKTQRKNLIFWICGAVAAISLLIIFLFGVSSRAAIYALFPLAISGWVAFITLNYKVFGASGKSSIHRSIANKEDEPG